jgi:zinc transport system ATP-binding protein
MTESAVPVVAVRNLFVAYEDKLALEDVSLDINSGEFWGILGPNGSGKTTLLRTMVGLLSPLAGTVTLFGQPSTHLNEARQRIGYVPQNSVIDPQFPIRVREVVLLGRCGIIGLGKRPKKIDHEAVDHALELVDLQDLSQRQIGQLSGGQRQRVLIARALALMPELLLLDEPTAALDVGASESFYAWLHQMHTKLKSTLVIVSHDVGVVSRYVTAVACLNRRLVAHGVPNEVLSTDTLEGMYGCDAVFFRHGDVPHLVVSHEHKPATNT